jgi:hypothetical protein
MPYDAKLLTTLFMLSVETLIPQLQPPFSVVRLISVKVGGDWDISIFLARWAVVCPAKFSL